MNIVIKDEIDNEIGWISAAQYVFQGHEKHIYIEAIITDPIIINRINEPDNCKVLIEFKKEKVSEMGDNLKKLEEILGRSNESGFKEALKIILVELVNIKNEKSFAKNV